MRTIGSVFLLTLVGSLALAQSASPPAPPGGNSTSSIASDLDRLQSAAAAANLDIGRMRIDKWKADGSAKQQAEINANSLQRNLTTALPGLIDNFRRAPQDLSAGFRLYRNLNALYDVFVSFTESAGAFGPGSEYDALSQQLNVIDSVRRDLGDDLERLASATQAELNQLRTQVRTMQEAPPPAPPKKVIVDNSEPAKKTTHKKKTSSANPEKSNTGTSPASSKSQ